MTTVNDIKTVENKFINSLGSGEKAGEYMQTLVQSVVKSRDTTVLARAIHRAHNKGDASAESLLKFVVGQVWPGAKYSGKKGEVPTIRIKDVTEDEGALARLDEAVKKGYSIRATTFRKTVRGETKKPKFDPKAWAERQAKTHDAKELDKMIAALQAAKKAAAK